MALTSDLGEGLQHMVLSRIKKTGILHFKLSCFPRKQQGIVIALVLSAAELCANFDIF